MSLHDIDPIATLDTFQGILAAYATSTGSNALHLDIGDDRIAAGSDQHEEIVAFARAIVAHADKIPDPFEGQVIEAGANPDAFAAWLTSLPVESRVTDRDGDYYIKRESDEDGRLQDESATWLLSYAPLTLSHLAEKPPAVKHQYPEGLYRDGDTLVYVRHEDTTDRYALTYVVDSGNPQKDQAVVNRHMNAQTVGYYTLITATS